MKLTSEDKKLLLKWGYRKEDFNQIEKATSKTMYELSKEGASSEEIPLSEALEILGRETYLNGISRSAFHWSACRDNGNGQTIYFDSSKLFK